jgi:hypothetical protein
VEVEVQYIKVAQLALVDQEEAAMEVAPVLVVVMVQLIQVVVEVAHMLVQVLAVLVWLFFQFLQAITQAQLQAHLQ